MKNNPNPSMRIDTKYDRDNKIFTSTVTRLVNTTKGHRAYQAQMSHPEKGKAILAADRRNLFKIFHTPEDSVKIKSLGFKLSFPGRHEPPPLKLKEKQGALPLAAFKSNAVHAGQKFPKTRKVQTTNFKSITLAVLDRLKRSGQWSRISTTPV